MKTILIRGGRVIDPGSGTDEVRDLFLSEGKIAELPADNDMRENGLTKVCVFRFDLKREVI